jgi:hypothetical protein
MSNQTFEGLPKPPRFMQVPSEDGCFPNPLTIGGHTQIGGEERKRIEIHIYPGPSNEFTTQEFTEWEWNTSRLVSPGPHYIHTRMHWRGEWGDWYDTGWFYVLTPPE